MPEILIGNSNGRYIAKALDIPLVRVGLPIHDRVGAQRILTVGYRGALELLDRITNAILEANDTFTAPVRTEMAEVMEMSEITTDNSCLEEI